MKVPLEFEHLSKRDLIRLLLSEREEFEKRIGALEKRLALYENAHTPSSKLRFPPKKEKKSNGKVGAPKGHPGVTREKPESSKTEKHVPEFCPFCGCKEFKKKKRKRRVIEELPEPQPVEVTEHLLETCVCKKCGRIVVPVTDLPNKGFFGKNLLSHVTLLKFEDRLPLRKVVKSLKRQHGIVLTNRTIFNITGRVSESLQQEYENIKLRIRTRKYVHIDQTELKLNGVKYDLWVFVTSHETLFLIRKGKRKQVMEEVLGKKYEGIIIGDGLETYRQYTDKIQRCWAHLLREAKNLAGKHEGTARNVYEELKELYETVKTITYEDPPWQRQELYDKLVIQMQSLIGRMNAHTKLRELAGKINNGLKHWFTRILYPFIEATNNVAERALRELIVQRKIMGTLRNKKGAGIVETIMTMITTWQQNELDTFTQLRKTI